MQIVVLIAILLAKAMPTLLDAPLGAHALAAAMGGYFAGVLALGALGILPNARHKTFRWKRRVSGAKQIWLVAGYAALLAAGFRDRIIPGLHLDTVPLLGHVLVLAPFVVAMILSWWLDYPLYRQSREQLNRDFLQRGENALPCWSLRAYLAFSARHQFLFIFAPIALILLVGDAAALYLPSLLGESDTTGWVIEITTIVGALTIFLVAPLLVTKVWKTHPLPEGPLREQLAGLCKAMEVRYRDILVWESGGVIANAAAMGLLGPVRYFLLTDALLARADARSIRAIFAHEIGHILGRHLWYLGLFAFASIFLCAALAGFASALLPESLQADAAEGLAFALLAVTWWLGFGYVSRRFERQSDVIGAWASDPDRKPGDLSITPLGAQLFACSLERVAELNGLSLSRRNWRHGCMAGRIQYILQLGENPEGSRQEIDSLVKRIKLLLLLALTAGLLLTGWQMHLATPS